MARTHTAATPPSDGSKDDGSIDSEAEEGEGVAGGGGRRRIGCNVKAERKAAEHFQPGAPVVVSDDGRLQVVLKNTATSGEVRARAGCNPNP
jgi:hypothetical protein